jgi:hypothetical protein
VQTVKQNTLLIVLGPTFGDLPHLTCRGLTFFERRFLKELEESLVVRSKTAFYFFECFLHLNRSARMFLSPQLPVSMSHVEELADFLVLFLPIFPLTSPGTVQGGLALSAAPLELMIR